MENTQKTQEENLQRIADNLDKQQKDAETKGVVHLIFLPIWIYLIYQSLKMLMM